MHMAWPRDAVERINFFGSTGRSANIGSSLVFSNRHRLGEAYLSWIEMLLSQWPLRIRVCYDLAHPQASTDDLSFPWNEVLQRMHPPAD